MGGGRPRVVPQPKGSSDSLSDAASVVPGRATVAITEVASARSGTATAENIPEDEDIQIEIQKLTQYPDDQGRQFIVTVLREGIEQKKIIEQICRKLFVEMKLPFYAELIASYRTDREYIVFSQLSKEVNRNIYSIDLHSHRKPKVEINSYFFVDLGGSIFAENNLQKTGNKETLAGFRSYSSQRGRSTLVEQEEKFWVEQEKKMLLYLKDDTLYTIGTYQQQDDVPLFRISSQTGTTMKIEVPDVAQYVKEPRA